MAYPDYGPIMLLSEASVQDLSSKLDQEVTTERFRPSIVIGDCEPFDEVCWSVGQKKLKTKLENILKKQNKTDLKSLLYECLLF